MKHFEDCKFPIRDQSSIANNLEKLKILKRKNPLVTNYLGVKKLGIFQRLTNYHIITGQPPDIMHDMLEGTIPLNFYFMMVKFKTDKILTVEDLNSALKAYKYGRVDIKDGKVPFNLFTKKSLTIRSGFKMSATNTWTLSRIFPVIFGGRLRNNRHFIHYLEGLKIFWLLMADSFTERSISAIEEKISKYLTDFKTNYNYISPKLHFLVHYGRMIRTFGALKNCWVMRFESKHSYFKRVQHSIHNTINTSKSLANRHQYLQIYRLMSTTYFLTEDIQSGPINKDQELATNFEFLIERGSYTSVSWDIFRSIKYYIGCVVLTPELKFSKISYVIIKENKLYFILTPLTYHGYQSHMNCFYVSEIHDAVCTLFPCADLEYIWPMDLNLINNKLFVIMKYPACELSLNITNPNTSFYNIFN